MLTGSQKTTLFSKIASSLLSSSPHSGKKSINSSDRQWSSKVTTSVRAGNREIVFELLFDLNRFLHGNEADIAKLLEDIHSE